MSTTYNEADPYAGSRETTEGRVYTVTGGDWDRHLAPTGLGEERIVVNMGPQHPSTHGVLRLVLELEGETVTKARVVIGYLHTGIEKNLEYRNWTQGTTFVTRMDYLAPLFNEAGLLPRRREAARHRGARSAPRSIRVLMMELNRIASHLVGLATGGMELGALTGMTNGFRERRDDPRHLRDDHRPADEPRLHPARRARAGPARRARSRRSAEFLRGHAASASPTTTSCSPATRSGSAG